MKFSERYGYVKPDEALKRGYLDKEGATALCNCYDYLYKWLNRYDIDKGFYHDDSYTYMEESIWCFFMNQRRDDFYHYNSHEVVATEYLLSDLYEWYTKFDLIEYSINYLRQKSEGKERLRLIVDCFVKMISSTFKRLNYAYRIVDDYVVELTDDEEIKSIEESLKVSPSTRTHLSGALKNLSKRPNPDYRNSIKESISAVEALCREITGETTLGKALKALEKNGVIIPKFLNSAIENLYIYTNDAKTGIRHALMDDKDAPQYDEAKFMLVVCSALINYIQGKRS